MIKNPPQTRFKCPECGEEWNIASRKISYEFKPICYNCETAMKVTRRRDLMQVELDGYTENPEMRIAVRGGVSHDSRPEDLEDARRRIKDFVKRGHYSTLEFADATFHVDGISRSCLAQLTRHRHASFMVESMRYVEQNEADIVIPPSIEGTEYEGEFEEDAYESYAKYIKLVKMGVPKEDARFLLPLAWPTELYVKANFREWRHIIDLRGLNEHAQHEIRELAQRILEKLYPVAPSVFGDQYEKLGDM